MRAREGDVWGLCLSSCWATASRAGPCSPGHGGASHLHSALSPCPGAGHLRAARPRPARRRSPAPTAGSSLPRLSARPALQDGAGTSALASSRPGDSEQFAPPCARAGGFQPQARLHSAQETSSGSGVGAEPRAGASSVFLATSLRKGSGSAVGSRPQGPGGSALLFTLEGALSVRKY